MSALPGSAEGTAVTGLDSTPGRAGAADLPPLTEQTRLEAREIMARYPVARSALLPMLHLVQSAARATSRPRASRSAPRSSA